MSSLSNPTLEIRSIGPSPSRNPFARPKLAHSTNNGNGTSSGSFTRKTLLPGIGLSSPAKLSKTATTTTNEIAEPVPQRKNSDDGQMSTPLGGERRSATQSGTGVGATSGKSRNAWRLLWRGGLEIGREGWRLDGITFFALLSFPPPTPSALTATPNPFDAPIQPHSTPSTSTVIPTATSPFPLLQTGDTDLCLSLESMRGRKYLQVRGLVDLPSDEVLEGAGAEGGSDDSGGVQMSIAPGAPLLAAYFTGLLCRNEKLSPTGRTLSAIVIGLGDEGVDPNPNSSILVYGQRQDIDSSTGEGGQPTLRLCVGRRKPPPPPPAAKKVRPGEPLPRAPLFFPAKAPKKPPPPFPNRSLSRTSSLSSSIYHPPPQASSSVASVASAQTSVSAPTAAPAPVSGRTPGRRGEKRPRKYDPDIDGREDNTRKRKAGRIVFDRTASATSASVGFEEGAAPAGMTANAEREEEDIFGRRTTASIGPSASISMSRAASSEKMINQHLHSEGAGEMTDGAEGGGTGNDDGAPNTGRAKRVRVPQQVLDNKAAVRKQTLVLLEGRGISRSHEMFKDVFGMTTKGAYFAFRDQLQDAPLSKLDVQRIVNGHLDMYLPPPPPRTALQDDAYALAMEEEAEDLVKIEMKEEYEEVKLEGTFLHLHEIEGRIKLEAVVEEDEVDMKEE
ncbi:hypothetical protein CI109_102551 [Kwoniella shandongensis]|uniref:Uncharacterized protein n=1 Tax=Kwoniella shandongensis TaxID=1734106 RepID=A0A5M6BUD3_9TREE|nr:uncharacterized protein CI109_005834 [Kwoniella shandongensis]KAA5525811.1 hypothetical protein CI109_005834 [Kwoniella shandongensis]